MRLKGFLILLMILILSCGSEDKKNIPLSDYVPHNALAAIQINNLSSLVDSLENNEFISRLENLEPYKAIIDKIAFLEQIDRESNGMLIFSKSERDSVEVLFISDTLSNMFHIDSLRNKYAELISFDNHTFDRYVVNDKAVYSSVVDNRLFISTSAELLDENLQLTEGDTSVLFQRLYAIADKKKPANLFLNLKENESLLSQITSDSLHISISKFSDWVYFDTEIRTDFLALSGLAVSNDSTTNYLNLFKDTEPLPNATPFFAPLESEALLTYTFNDQRVFKKNQKHFLSKVPKNDSIFNTVEEIGIVRVNRKKAVLVKTYGSEGLLDFLALHQKSTSNYQGNSIRELGDTNFLNANFEPLVQNFVANYSTVLENVFVFTENKETVQTIISNYKNGNTFGKNPVYGFASKNVGSSASILWISNASHVEQLVKDNFVEGIHVNLKDSKFNGYAFAGQMVANGDFFHINLSAQKMSTEKALKIIKPLFTVSLDAEPATNPQFITNHNTKKKEIIVQDITNKLYLISNNGKILWKKQLKGPVQGNIHQVDLYKNGRLQLAFTTNSEFLILDRNGKEVKPFTISYEGGNLNSLAVFDYEGKKDYRFVVTQGEKVFMYDRNAKIVKGFKYTRADRPILDAPKHLVVGNKDYLAFKLENGSLHLLNRVGDVRNKVSEKIDFSENEVYIYKNKFILTDKKGTLYQVDTQGKITKTAFNLNEDHGLDATGNTLVYMNDNTLSIKGKTIELDLGVYTKPKIFYLNDKIYVSVTDIQNQQVHLFDSQAKPIPNFPIFGTSTIDLNDMDNDQKLELTVKNQDNSIIVYAIN